MKEKKTKYIFVVGGVLSGVGKGVTAASIGRIFKNYGFNVVNVKLIISIFKFWYHYILYI